jgi:hypothetical protein
LVEPGGNERSMEARRRRETPQLVLVKRTELREHQAMQASGRPLGGCEQLGFAKYKPESDGPCLFTQ